MIYTWVNPTSEKDMAKACYVLENDGVIAYPTDVNWGFACDVRRAKAVQKLRRLKPSHPKQQPFTLICKDLSMVSELAIVEQPAYRILRRILPGPWTVLLKSQKSLPKQIFDKRENVGVRVPQSPLVLDLIERLGAPLLSTSMPQEDLLQFGYQVDEKYGHALDLILDLGDAVPWLETSILDLTEHEPILVRHGEGDPKEVPV
ncbi:MAG: L-threonylcarbamoyladenylate synthase [Oligoflexales bacterium]